MSCTIVLELFLPFRLFKKTANIRCTTTSAQILNAHENKTKWRLALKRKTGAAAKHLLIEPRNQPARPAPEPWNHRTKNLKSLKNMVCCRLMPGSNQIYRDFKITCMFLRSWLSIRASERCPIMISNRSKGALSIKEKNPAISVVARGEFPIDKKLFHLVVNPGPCRCPTVDLELVQTTRNVNGTRHSVRKF